MQFSRPRSLRAGLIGLLAAYPLFSQQQPAPQQPKPPNPFEQVPQAAEEPKPQPPKPDQAKPLTAGTPDRPPADTIESINFRGARKVPQDTLRAMIFTKRGDAYDADTLHRDLITLWNSNRFDNIEVTREPGQTGWIITFVVAERPVVRTIKYDGLKSITTSEVLDRFKERRVGLTPESTYDRNKVQRAQVVLQDYLAERGRQFATVMPELQPFPPSSLNILFKVDEGPKVKVGTLDFEGNTAYSDRVVRRAMRNLRPIGVPRSIVAENLFARTYDSTKLEEDEQRIVQFYQSQGYFTTRVTGQSVNIVDVGGGKFRLPLIHPNRPGKNANIAISIEEGRLYHLNTINFVGVKLFRTPEELFPQIFRMKQGDPFSTEKLQKGFDELRKLYGRFGYINFLVEPEPEPIPGSDKINLTLRFDEGNQFFVRRIDFSGNTTTRDKVIRRELLIDEGDPFNTDLWRLSILRLNQLGYFETLKETESVDMKTDNNNHTVDLTLKVRERGKNTIQFSGGISGISGSFVGFSYSTNNFLGLGETLSLSSQLGTRTTDVSFGFTEPYFLDRPMQVGFTVFMSRFNFDQAREASVLAGADLIPLYNSLGSQNLLNYTSNSRGFTTFLNYPLKRSFQRLGVSYGYSIQNVRTLTSAAAQYYDYLNFQNINGPQQNSLDGIRTSSVTPTYSYNSVNNPMTPTAGTGFQASLQFAGSILGGNVNQIEPQLDFRHFRKGLRPGHVIAMHLLARYVTGYGGKVAPPFNRFYMGGENDVRGFELWGAGPWAFVPNTGQVNVLNTDGSPRQQKYIDPKTGAVSLVNAGQTIPSYQMVFPGGDTNIVANFEYRIPIIGQTVTLAPFFDAGMNRISNKSQLKLNPSRISDLNGQFPEAAFGDSAVVAAGTQVIRTSTGIELQVLMPVFNQPFRIYWAFNPTRVQEYLQPPIVADRSYFPNQASFVNSILTFGQPQPLFEKRSQFRFTIGRTF
ncbi:MAG TPA: outer membrane protein assembly factor BamA [Bryobacteraceae bacterium]|nr:outer membrane protein assembly factor BamA [Bryobacteraceae bacterium]